MSDLGSQTPYPSQPPPGGDYQAPAAPAPTGRASGPRAGFWQRFGAYLIDLIILVVPVVIVMLITNQNVANLASIVFTLAYFSYFEGGPTGQTVGKRVLGIRVIDFKVGGPIGYGRGLLRTVARYLSGIILLLGYLWMLWDPEKQTWHDKIAGTVVVPVDAYPVR
ncbi:MAG TPA: RDD family protein [Solirubrobacteraceae bacterium]|nr:RDD family protein [Solirubrobacteraceae bacterium]